MTSAIGRPPSATTFARDRPSLTPDELRALVGCSAAVRLRAQEFVIRCVELHAKSDAHRQRLDAQVDTLIEARARLFEVVSDYAKQLGRLAITADRAIVLTTELVDESIWLLPAEVQEQLRNDVSWWCIESYAIA